MKPWKRAGPVALSLALCAGLVLPALAHTVTIDGGDTQQVDTVQAGVEKIGSKTGTITMDRDDPVTGDGVTINQGNVTLDLNGHSITNNDSYGTAEISGDAIVTGKTGVQVEDSSTFTMDGGTVGSTVNGGAAVDGTGTITLNGGTIYGSVPNDVDISNVTVKDAPAPTPTPAPDPAPASDPLTRPAAAKTLLKELFRRVGGSGDLWAWAVENGLIDEDGDGEEIVTVALLRAILTRYAEAFGGNAVAVEELTTLTGEDTDVVDNCRAVLKEFFGE